MFKSRFTAFVISLVFGLSLTYLITTSGDKRVSSSDSVGRSEHRGSAQIRSSVCVEDKNYYLIKGLELEIEIQELTLQILRNNQNEKARQKQTLQELSNRIFLSEKLRALKLKQQFEKPVYREVCY